MIKGIEAVGFDLDNTLYKMSPKIETAIRDNIFSLTSAATGRSYRETEKEFLVHYDVLHSASESLSRMGVRDGKLIVQKAMENADVASALQEDRKLSKMMDSLAKRYKLFIITGSSADYTSKKLAALGILEQPNKELFTIKVCGDSTHRREDGSAFRYVSEKLSVPFGRMMFIGDRETVDIIPAKRLGITTAIVNSSSEKADYNLDEIYHLEKLLL